MSSTDNRDAFDQAHKELEMIGGAVFRAPYSPEQQEKLVVLIRRVDSALRNVRQLLSEWDPKGDAVGLFMRPWIELDKILVLGNQHFPTQEQVRCFNNLADALEEKQNAVEQLGLDLLYKLWDREMQRRGGRPPGVPVDGRKIQTERKQLGLTQREMWLGLNMEKGPYQRAEKPGWATMENLSKIAAAFGLLPEDLLLPPPSVNQPTTCTIHVGSFQDVLEMEALLSSVPNVVFKLGQPQQRIIGLDRATHDAFDDYMWQVEIYNNFNKLLLPAPAAPPSKK